MRNDNYEYKISEIKMMDSNSFEKIKRMYFIIPLFIDLIKEMNKKNKFIKPFTIEDVVFLYDEDLKPRIQFTSEVEFIELDKDYNPKEIEAIMVDPFLHALIKMKKQISKHQYLFNNTYQMITVLLSLIDDSNFPFVCNSMYESMNQYLLIYEKLNKLILTKEYQNESLPEFRLLRLIIQLITMFIHPICFQRSIEQVECFWKNGHHFIE